MSRATQTGVDAYLAMPMRQVMLIRKALVNVLRREEEAREERR